MLFRWLFKDVHLLYEIRKELNRMTATLQDLDDKINELLNIDANLATAVALEHDDTQKLLVALATAGVAPDFQPEVDKVTTAIANTQAAIDALKSSDALVNPPSQP